MNKSNLQYPTITQGKISKLSGLQNPNPWSSVTPMSMGDRERDRPMPMPMPFTKEMKLEEQPPPISTGRFEAAPIRRENRLNDFSNPEPPSNFGRDPRFEESQNFNEPDYFDEPAVSPPRGASPFESSPLVCICTKCLVF